MTEFEKAHRELCDIGFNAELQDGISGEEVWIFLRIPGTSVYKGFRLDYETICEWADKYDGGQPNEDLIDIERDND